MLKKLIPVLCLLIIVGTSGANNAYPSTASEFALNNCEITVWEGEIVSPELVASDPDEFEGFGPAGGILWTYTSPLSNEGIWHTQEGDKGVYTTHVTISDGEFDDDLEFCIEVLEPNKAPIAQDIDVEMTVGQSVQFIPQVTDPNGGQVYVFFEHPIQMEGHFTATTPGVFAYSYQASDGELTDTAVITITILPRENPPQTFVHDHIEPEFKTFTIEHGEPEVYVVEHTEPETQEFIVEHIDDPFKNQDHIVVGVWHTVEEPKSELHTDVVVQPLPQDTHIALELTHKVYPTQIIT